MRLSGFVVPAILLVSVALLAQHSSGGGGSSSGGSHSSSGGSSSSASSASSHSFSGSASHVGSTSAPASHSSSSKSPSTKANASAEKKSSRSFSHPFKKSKPVQSAEFKRPVPCLKGRCAGCPRGQSRNGYGACAVASNVCSSGQYFSCGRFGDCNALAQELAELKRQMQSQSDYGQSLRYRALQEQYEQCLRRFSSGRFGAYAFDNAFLFDTP
jgi:hypothetical protein